MASATLVARVRRRAEPAHDAVDVRGRAVLTHLPLALEPRDRELDADDRPLEPRDVLGRRVLDGPGLRTPGLVPGGELAQVPLEERPVVDEAQRAPVFPLVADIRGADGIPKKNWNVEIAEERFMSSGLLASVLGSIVDASISERRDVTWKIKSKVTVRNHGTIEVEDIGERFDELRFATALADDDTLFDDWRDF
jgi:hypothetical protein